MMMVILVNDDDDDSFRDDRGRLTALVSDNHIEPSTHHLQHDLQLRDLRVSRTVDAT